MQIKNDWNHFQNKLKIALSSLDNLTASPRRYVLSNLQIFIKICIIFRSSYYNDWIFIPRYCNSMCKSQKGQTARDIWWISFTQSNGNKSANFSRSIYPGVYLVGIYFKWGYGIVKIYAGNYKGITADVGAV